MSRAPFANVVLTVNADNVDRIVVEQETEDEIIPLFEVFYLDPVEDSASPIRDRATALQFATELVTLWNGRTR